MKMFGQRIKKLRKERGAALKQVADASGLSQGYLSQIETDKVEPSIAMLRRLSSYYMVSLLYFFDTDPVDGVVRNTDMHICPRVVWSSGRRSLMTMFGEILLSGRL